MAQMHAGGHEHLPSFPIPALPRPPVKAAKKVKAARKAPKQRR